MALPLIVPLAASAIPSIYQGIKGLSQKRQARKLQESKFMPQELLMNRDLAMQQAYSRRAPGQALAEENVRRNLANQISAGVRSGSRGDVNRTAAITSAATAQANDATRRIAAQGQAFSEGALDRLRASNMAIAGQKRQNRMEYDQTKAQLLAASDQNIFNSLSNLGTLGLVAAGTGGGKAGQFAQGMTMAQNPWMYADPSMGVWNKPGRRNWRQSLPPINPNY